MEHEEYISITTPSSGVVRRYKIIEDEQWKPVVGFENLYYVSDYGRIKTFHKRWGKHPIRLLTERVCSWGYMEVCLKDDKGEYHRCVHRLVAEAWIENPERKPQVNHKNGIKTDNRLENLEWVTKSENVQHGYDIGLNHTPNGEDNHWALLTKEQVLEIFNSKLPASEMAKKHNVGESAVHKIRIGKNWKHLTKKKHVPLIILTPAQVLEIFHSTLSVKEIAVKYNTTESNVYIIKTGKNWSHVTGKNHVPAKRAKYEYEGRITSLEKICKKEGWNRVVLANWIFNHKTTLEEAIMVKYPYMAEYIEMRKIRSL